ncbi:hypothetical protein BSIN_0115 [Burkholderia singularis]|uniref:Uncharacterized protein n=1 Tax=Burkholderia singularis TaxID=1503053 RepID=A0A238H2G3_9BURK|nr:hypothetical protein BSIN_0115 [Burkholderia singularis]
MDCEKTKTIRKRREPDAAPRERHSAEERRAPKDCETGGGMHA